MKIKKFKLELKLKDVYNRLKQLNIQVTDEIIVLVDVVKKEVDELVIPSVLFENFSVKDPKIENFKKTISLPKDTAFVTFVISTLGDKIEKIILETTDQLKKTVLETIIEEYLNSAIIFVSRILKEKIEEDIEIGNSFLLPPEYYKEVISLLSAEKIDVYLKENNTLSPLCTNISYIPLFKSKK